MNPCAMNIRVDRMLSTITWLLHAMDFTTLVLATHSERMRVASTNVVKSIACKSQVIVLNIRSTRMFMAHGFMRRIFEVFDRYETSVDMVATSEASVSLTVDQPEQLAGIVGGLSEFSDVSGDENQA